MGRGGGVNPIPTNCCIGFKILFLAHTSGTQLVLLNIHIKIDWGCPSYLIQDIKRQPCVTYGAFIFGFWDFKNCTIIGLLKEALHGAHFH